MTPADHDCLDHSPTLLVTLTGHDRPGVSARLFDALAEHDVEVVDVEQVVIRGQLVLGVLLSAAADADLDDVESSVRGAASATGMEVELTHGTGDGQPRARGRAFVTLLGRNIRSHAVAAITGRVYEAGANIDRIVRMSRQPVTTIELQVSGADVSSLRRSLAAAASEHQVDVAVQEAGVLRHGRRLVIMDVDSTLVQGEVVDLLAERAGVGDEVARVTEAAMRGELDFEESLRRRVALLQGLPVTVLDEVYDSLKLAPGARTFIRTLRTLGYHVGIVSGGFSHLTERLKSDLALDYARANTLDVVDGRLTGRVLGDVVDRAAKARALREFAEDSQVDLARTVAIGDGANDLDMLTLAGLGIAYNAKPVVRDAAHTALSVPYLDAVLSMLGITRDDVEAVGCDAPA